jgi:hypothetical protein
MSQQQLVIRLQEEIKVVREERRRASRMTEECATIFGQFES